MNDQFPPLPGAQAPTSLRASRLPGWPRLMGERMAADYLGIGTSLLRDVGPPAKKLKGRTVWDRKDLDRFADGLDGQPLDDDDLAAQAKDVERAWRDKRAKRKGA